MALNKFKLEQDIKMAFKRQQKNTGDQEAAIAQISHDIAAAVDAYVRLATVNPGQMVVTAGSAVAQTGATTSPGTLS